MCINKYVLVVMLCVALYTDSAKCAPKRHTLRDYSDDDYNYSDDEFDLNYDQRQNGTENIRVVIDGVVIAIPGQEISSPNNDAISLLGGLLDEILSGANYDDGDLPAGEHLTNETSEATVYHTNDKDKWPIYEFEQIYKDNNTINEKINKTMFVPSSFESTIVGSQSSKVQSTTLSPALISVNSKESSKHYVSQKKQYSEQRPRNKFRFASLLKSIIKRRSH